jgi:transposase
MLSISGSSRIFLYRPGTDMRKSFRGLCALIHAHLGRPEDGAYYVFVNRRRMHVKVLYFDGDGVAIWQTQLARGQFRLPAAAGPRVALDRRSLAMLLEGVVPRRLHRRYAAPERV